MLEDLGSQVEAIALLSPCTSSSGSAAVLGQKMFDEAISDPNFLGATGRDAHLMWAAFRRELPLLLMVFFAPVLIGLVFLLPTIEVIASIRPGRTYSPLRTAFLVTELRGSW
jgi:hypothetical protein